MDPDGLFQWNASQPHPRPYILVPTASYILSQASSSSENFNDDDSIESSEDDGDNFINGEDGRRICSVRTCVKALPVDAKTKMCETCREKHRTYASTKRQRRKKEKQAVMNIVGAAIMGQTVPLPVAPTSAACNVANDTNANITTHDNTGAMEWAPNHASWDNSAIDPQLFAESSDTTNSLHFVRPPYASTSSSELAGALTLPASEGREWDKGKEKEKPLGEVEEPNVYPYPYDMPDKDIKEEDWKECTVRGCKAWIPITYAYKMCVPCRTRYRSYGNTKRRKWKAEREAQDKELLSATGATRDRLTESIEDLLAVIAVHEEDQERQRAAVGAAASTSSDPEDKPGPIALGIHPTRMCTVSHCHTILPPMHRYKRCEQHRMQNRHHSQLKRIRELEREKKEKEGVLKNGESGADDESKEDEDGGKAGEGSTSGAGEVGETMEEDKGEDKDKDMENGKLRKRTYRCATTAPPCSNLLAPNVRWRHCDICRARTRMARRDHGGQEGELERLRSIVRMLGKGTVEDSSTGDGEGGAGNDAGSNEAGEAAIAPHAGNAMVVDEPAVVNASTFVLSTNATTSPNVDMAPPASATGPGDINIAPASSAAPVTTTTSSMNTPPAVQPRPPAKVQPHTFQHVFRANITLPPDPPSSTSSSHHPSPTPSAPVSVSPPPARNTWSTPPGELTFREYVPKPASASSSKPIMGQGEETFREMVGRDAHQKTSNGILGPAAYLVYKAAPAPTGQGQGQGADHAGAVASAGSSAVSVSASAPPSKKQRTDGPGVVASNQAAPPILSAPAPVPVPVTYASTSVPPPPTSTAPPASAPNSTYISQLQLQPQSQAPRSPGPTVIPRQRKPRSRAMPKPPAPSPAPAPPPAPQPAYSYPSYPYYSPPGYPGYYAPPHTGTSGSAPASHAYAYPYPYPYPYAHPYTPPYPPSSSTTPPAPYGYPYTPSSSQPYPYPYPYPHAQRPSAYGSYGYSPRYSAAPGYGYSPQYPTQYPPADGVAPSYNQALPPHPSSEDPEGRKQKGDQDGQAGDTHTHAPPIPQPTPAPPTPIVAVPFTLQASASSMSRVDSQSLSTTPMPPPQPSQASGQQQMESAVTNGVSAEALPPQVQAQNGQVGQHSDKPQIVRFLPLSQYSLDANWTFHLISVSARTKLATARCQSTCQVPSATVVARASRNIRPI
ncbi:hypothetical protein DXG01_001992 [Tephrocybe rancida]|nr:hypothetical protein DXG01_001992 [Tephrocybe rancida]